jgi:hypothetical protein
MIDHWLLHLAAEYPVWLTQVFPVVDDVGLNVKPVPGASAEVYTRALIALYDWGAVALSSEAPGDDVQSAGGVRRVVERFVNLSLNGAAQPLYRRIRIPGMQVRFELTARGGEMWESLAQPDWTRILTVSADLDSADVFSPNRDLLAKYLNDEGVAADSVAWQTHTDFEILYWKRLPVVYQASFAMQPTIKLREVPWHKKPWELPNWPA